MTVASAAPSVSSLRRAEGGARDRQVTSGRCGRARSALERWGGGVVRQVSAARRSGVRHLIPGRRREARQREVDAGGRDADRPQWRSQRRNTALGPAIEGRQALRCRRTELLAAGEQCPQRGIGRRSARMPCGDPARADLDAGQAPRRVDRTVRAGRCGQRRERLNYGEPEGGKQEHQRNLRGQDAGTYPASLTRVSDPPASTVAAGEPRSRRVIRAARPSIRASRRPPPCA